MAAGSGPFPNCGCPCAGDGAAWAVPGVEGSPFVSSSRWMKVNDLAIDIFRKLMTKKDYIKGRQRYDSFPGNTEDTHFL